MSKRLGSARGLAGYLAIRLYAVPPQNKWHAICGLRLEGRSSRKYQPA